LSAAPLSPSGRPIPPPPRSCAAHDWQRTDIVSELEGIPRLFWDACSLCGKQRFVVDGDELLDDG
jgi:hypothetical protein